LRRLERRGEARVAFERAADLAATERDRRFLARQIEELAGDGTLMQDPPRGAT
jgi:predicted RNA polymerase sigma factor